MEIKIKKLIPKARTPRYMTSGAAAADLYSCIDGDIVLESGKRTIVPTGLALSVPEGYCAVVCARSGLAAKSGIALANGIGVIDSDYRGELGVALINNSSEAFTITDGMRIAQLMIIPAPQFPFSEAEELPDSARGEGGFGSTGK